MARVAPSARVLLASLVVLGGIAVGWAPAGAQSARDDFYVTNGTVNATALAGGILYVGGSFTNVGPVTGGGVPLDAASGALAGGFPRVVGEVDVAIPDLAGGWYIGGLFTTVGGQPRSNLAHVLADLSVSPWNPGTNGQVRALAFADSVVYLGGAFSAVGGQPRNRIAAVDTAGDVTAWDANANGLVLSLALGSSALYAGGAFTSLGGQTRNRIAALDRGSAAATGWNPSANNQVSALLLDSGLVYAGGSFTSIGGAGRNRIAALDTLVGAATSWNPNANSQVLSLARTSSAVVAAGVFTSIGGQIRNRLAELDPASGLANGWNPNLNGQVSAVLVNADTVIAGGSFTLASGQPRSNLAALDGGTGSLLAWNPCAYGPVLALARGPGTVFAGGSFNGMGGLLRANLAAIDVVSGAATAWDPEPDNMILALAAGNGVVYAGGSFANIGGQPRASLAALDAVTGLATAWNPNSDGQITALALTDTTVVAGGSFNTLGGQPRQNLAALDVTTGLATAWNPGADGQVFVLATVPGVVYAGGDFQMIDGSVRNRIAAIDAASGEPTSWNPNSNGTVRALIPGCSIVYAGGFFTSIGGQARNSIAALSTGTGLASPWNPGANGPLFALTLDGGRVYAGGVYNLIGGQARNRVAALDPTTGTATPWNPNSSGTVRTLAAGAGQVYVGGGFSSIDGLQQSNLGAIESDVSFSCPPMAVIPGSLPTGVADSVYSQPLSTSGGTAPYCYALTSGALPAGLSLLSATGQITGVPDSAGTSVFTITSTDAYGCTGSTAFTLTIFATPPTSSVAANASGLCISPAHPCVTVPVQFYRTDSLMARGYSVTLHIDTARLGLCAAGPPSLSVHPGSWLAAYTNTVFEVVDDGGGSYTVDASLLGSPCGVTGGGQLFTLDLKSTGADGTGAISITSVKVRDCSGAVIPVAPGATAQLTILNTPIAILPDTLPAGALGIAYSKTLIAAAGAPPFTFTRTAGALPNGLTLSSGGVISGIPTATGSFPFTATVVDVNDCTGSHNYTIAISCSPIALEPADLAYGVVGISYSQTLTASAGTPPLHFTVTDGSLPTGLSLNSTSGLISGTPGAVGTGVFTVAVADSNGCTGSANFTLDVFSNPPSSTVAAQTTGLCLSNAHACVSVPFEYVKAESILARGMSVTFQIDTTRLALCSAGSPTLSVHPGSWLSGFSNTSFQVVSNGGGSYTVDQAILGQPCGVPGGGQLFTVDLKAAGLDGSGSIAVLSVKGRDCGSAAIPVMAGSPAALLIEHSPPPPIASLASEPVTSGNGPGPTTGITITWPGNPPGTVSLYRAPFGVYPEYDDGPASVPDSSLAPGAPWTLVSSNASSGLVDHPPVRGFWYYVARVSDDCGNLSAPSNLTHGSLDYFLGDVSNGLAAGTGDNHVGDEDISLLGAHYGITEPAITAAGVGYLDVGPTTDLSVTSRPTTDDRIDFEDLIVFATNYDQQPGPSLLAKAAARARAAGPTVPGAESFGVLAPSQVETGAEFEAQLTLDAGGRIQGFSAKLGWNPSVVTPDGIRSQQFIELQGGIVLSPQPGTVDAALLGARESGVEGSGTIATVRFRALRAGDPEIRLESVTARDRANHPVPVGNVAGAAPVRPSRTELAGARPNPTRGRATLEYSLAEGAQVNLVVYGVDGRRVRVVANGPREAGIYRESWDGRDESGRSVAPGMYYVRLTAGSRSFTRRLVLLR